MNEHDKEVITTMRDIMVLSINESDFISQPILFLLLVVWKQEWFLSCIAYGLIKSVLKQCKENLKPHLNKEKYVKEDYEEDSPCISSITHRCIDETIESNLTKPTKEDETNKEEDRTNTILFQ